MQLLSPIAFAGQISSSSAPVSQASPAAKGLARWPFDVTIIDRHNYHLFQPLLYQVATAGLLLPPADIASPIRSILRLQKNTRVILANVSGIDLAAREVLAEDRRIPYDILIIATGARHAYFGRDDWAPHAPGLKRIDDATYVRQRGRSRRIRES